MPLATRTLLHDSTRLLLVIAHPDDECMFFSPSINGVTCPVFVLCLSKGNAHGLGQVREKELQRACAIFQIPAGQITIVDDPQLQDGMTTQWPKCVIAHHVQAMLLKHQCNTILTFDDYGVSGHANHQAVHHGVRHLLQANATALNCTAWQLVSELLLRKYTSLLDIALSYLLRQQHQIVLVNKNVSRGVRAMQAHQSQWVWFRKLFVAFSSYTYVNTLEPMQLTSTDT
eukprot:jgi/Chrzof1/12424/Cz06g34060.t1